MADLNSEQLDNQQDSQDLEQTKTRRSFLKKATIGATIASIPAHSVWAGRLISGNMSGNVSGWGDDYILGILSHGYYKNPKKDAPQRDILFVTAFGGEPFSNNGKPTLPTGLTLLDVMENKEAVYTTSQNGGGGKNKTGGPGNVNMQLAAMYLNAFYHGTLTVWPVVENGTFLDMMAYGDYLYKQAALDPAGVGCELDKIIHAHHSGEEPLDMVCSA